MTRFSAVLLVVFSLLCFCFLPFSDSVKLRTRQRGKLNEIVLPEGWARYLDTSSGLFYYVNSVDGTSQWEMPTAAPVAIVRPDGKIIPDGWTELIDSASGAAYYYNGVDGTSQWEFPTAPATTVAITTTIPPTTTLAPTTLSPTTPVSAVKNVDMVDSASIFYFFIVYPIFRTRI